MYAFKEIFIIAAIAVMIVSSRQDIEINEGVMTINYKGNCSLAFNGYNVTMTGPKEVEGLFYGLVNYRCGNNIGWLVSKVACKKCGLFCMQNEMIEGCESKVYLFIIGTVVGCLIGLIGLLTLRNKLRKWSDHLISCCLYRLVTYEDKREEERVKMLRERVATDITPKYRELPPMKAKHMDKIEGKRSVRAGGSSVNNITVLSLLFMAAVAFGCDNTLFIRSDGKVCDDKQCISTSMYQLHLQSGSVVCFKDYKGDMMRFKIDAAYIRTRYHLVYYTSEYEIKTSYTSNCKGSGSCWSGGCRDIGVHPRLRAIANSSIMGYGCETDNLGCDDWCFMKTSCTWYKWDIKSKGVYGKVYEKSSEIWEVILRIDYQNVTTRHKVNVNNPRVNLDGLMDGIPIYITSISSETDNVPNGILEYLGTGYAVKASQMNMPETDIIGDYQISLDKETYAFNMHNVKCETESCRAFCNAPEPKMTRFIRMIKRMNEVEIMNIGSGHVIETNRQISAIVGVLVGNVNLKNLQVEKAQCSLEQIGTYSCTGCAEEPYVILQAHDIKSEGILPIESNCTFAKDYISCSLDPYPLYLRDTKRSCYIHIQGLNHTMYLNFDFTFKGSLDPSKPIYNQESEMEMIKGMVSSSMFITGLISTVSMFGMVSISLSMILRIIRMYEIKRMSRDVMEMTSK
ncbi:glycoprotein precursor [Wuhan mosquito virus 1]|uniref:Glycoprotein n=1 Tax=Wuhan mosquito virus 1 TaxID=1608126 RepID=A0A0B5KS44_9VIRU|nr:glycoprotein precursor [Wuhan mosquito virus 1]AJG39296.1 glycoprotein precursor [Wuhan mosquito virus 1]